MHDHPSTDLADLCGLGVAVGHDQITIGSLHNCVNLDPRLPLPDEGAELVTSKAHAVGVRQGIPAQDFLNAERAQHLAMHDHPHTDPADLCGCGLGVAVGHDQIAVGTLHTRVNLNQR